MTVCVAPSVCLTWHRLPLSISMCSIGGGELHKASFKIKNIDFSALYFAFLLPPLSLCTLLISSCCILRGEAGTELWELSCTDVFDSGAEVSRGRYMCGVDRLQPCSVYQALKPRGHRLTQAHSVAPCFHQRGTHFMRSNTNNVTRTPNTSFPVALQIQFVLFYSLYWQLEWLIHSNPKLSSAFSK